MINLPPGLTFIERFAALILTRSPRTSLIVLKARQSSGVFVAADTHDPVAAYIVGNMEEQAEPMSMLLERLYHAPAYGESE